MIPLAQLAQVCVGYTYRGSLKQSVEGDLAVIQMKDVNPEALAKPERLARIHLPQLLPRYRLQRGDLIFRARGLCNQAWVFDSEMPAICIAPLLFIHLHDTTQVLPAYLQWFINLGQTQARLASMARGVAIKMIGVQALSRLEIPVPQVASQQRIVELYQLLQQSQELEGKLAQKRKEYTEQALLQFAQR